MADATFSPSDAGHVLAHVDEWVEGAGTSQYDEFYAACDRRFVWSAPGHADVGAEARRAPNSSPTACAPSRGTGSR